MKPTFFKLCVLAIILPGLVAAENPCLDLGVTITQKLEYEGFHREIKWLVEIPQNTLQELDASQCRLCISLHVPPGMYINPDEIAEIARSSDLSAFVDGEVNVETPMHESEPHTFYIFLDNDATKLAISFPIHLRYQRAQITGGFGKVLLSRPSLLLNCSREVNVCRKVRRIYAPCSLSNKSTNCIWKNATYEALFEDSELYVPIGDQDDYPLVSVVTLLLGCFGTIYILSLLSSAPL